MKERCTIWYETKKSEKLAVKLSREDERTFAMADVEEGSNKKVSELDDVHHEEQKSPIPVAIPHNIQIIEAEPITDRKSAFVGRACRITDPAQVSHWSSATVLLVSLSIFPGAFGSCPSHGRQTDCASGAPYN